MRRIPVRHDRGHPGGAPVRWMATVYARLLRGTGAAVVLTTLTVLAAGPAQAHDSLLSTEPVDGATLSSMPAAIVLHFAEPAQRLGTAVVVLGSDGNVASGRPVIVASELRQPVTAGSPPGRYTVNWRVVSDDGHPVQGSFRFTTTTPTVSPGASSTSSSPTTVPSPALGASAAAPASPGVSTNPAMTASAPVIASADGSERVGRPVLIGAAVVVVVVAGAIAFLVSRRRRPPAR